MPNIVYSNAIVAGDPPLASAVSDNFGAILSVVNSSGLDSINFKVSGIGGGNIFTGEIVSEHISTSQVLGVHISTGQLSHNHFLWNSSSSGVRALQIADSANMASFGLEMVRVTGSASMNGASTFATTASWTAVVLDGGPRTWTKPPTVFGAPACYITATTPGPRAGRWKGINSHNFAIHFDWSAAVTGPFTWHVAAIGEPTV